MGQHQFIHTQVQFTTHVDADAVNKGHRRNTVVSKDWRDVLIIFAIVSPIIALFGWVGWVVVKMLIR